MTRILRPIIAAAVTALAVAFRAAAKIKEPDIDGTIYLDPATFVIRRSVLRLSRIPREIEQFDAISVDTRFEEVYPGLPIVTTVDGIDRYAHPERGTNGAPRRSLTERQRVIALEFSRGEPGDSVRRVCARRSRGDSGDGGWVCHGGHSCAVVAPAADADHHCIASRAALNGSAGMQLLPGQ